MKKNILFLLLSIVSVSLSAEDIKVRVAGDGTQGYYADIYEGERLISDQSRSGEADICLANEDYSILDTIRAWKAQRVEYNGDETVLSGDVYLKKFEAYLNIRVSYKVVSDSVVAKNIELQQNNLSLLYYSLGTSITSDAEPAAFWSFDDNDNRGGVVHETYPAAGYMIDGNLAVGLLTDAGNRNLWTRNIRRRPSKQGDIGFRAIREICDANMIRIADAGQRAAGDYSVKYTFGEVSDFNHPVSVVKCTLPDIRQWKSYQGAAVKSKSGIYNINGKADGVSMAGMLIPLDLQDGFYTIRFKHRSSNAVSMRLFKGDGTDNTEVAGLHYQTDIPSSESSWVEQEETVFLANTEGGKTSLLLAASGLTDGGKYSLEIKDLEVLRSDAARYAYHRLEQGKKAVKKLFIFAVPARPVLHDLRLASQVCLADGLGMKGSVEEKCLYACYQMLVWITSRNNFAPLNVPSINYAPDMYNRDSFWSLMGIYDKETSEQIFDEWAATQGANGAIGTIITPCMGSTEVKGNEATLEFLWFALVNHRQYGTPLNMDKLTKAYNYIINEFDPDGDGICSSEFVLGQNDVVTYPERTSGLAVNQGMFAVTLQVARELGFPVSDDYIAKACQEYRNFYDSERGYLIDNRDYPHSITFNSLLPEFVSWWLFDKPILTSEMVINTLDRIPYHNGYSPIISHVDNVYFTMEDKPFSPNMFWDNGVYYNAGSWLREEICGYVAGLKHGWKNAEGRIRERLNVEITLHPDEPFSHEFLPYDVNVPGCWWPSTRVFSWNVFALRALEVAGMRTPEQDPGYSHK